MRPARALRRRATAPLKGSAAPIPCQRQATVYSHKWMPFPTRFGVARELDVDIYAIAPTDDLPTTVRLTPLANGCVCGKPVDRQTTPAPSSPQSPPLLLPPTSHSICQTRKPVSHPLTPPSLNCHTIQSPARGIQLTIDKRNEFDFYARFQTKAPLRQVAGGRWQVQVASSQVQVSDYLQPATCHLPLATCHLRLPQSVELAQNSKI